MALLIDTDTLTALARRRSDVTEAAEDYLERHGVLSFSAITRFEILRGLKVKNAIRQIQWFEELCNNSQILPIDDSIILQAADIYADLHRRGQLIGDADILIAATALVHGMGVVTNNVAHFSRVPGLHIENWLVS
jgi:tRNA(fMet)-specific endonuclease VapC